MGKVVCELCPRGCVIPEGGAGDCRVRVNIGVGKHAPVAKKARPAPSGHAGSGENVVEQLHQRRVDRHAQYRVAHQLMSSSTRM